MYALIYKNKVISGPRSWSAAFWSQLLKNRGHSVDIFNTPPQTLPYIIDEHTEIREAQLIQPTVNQMIQQLRGPSWDLSGDQAVATYEIEDLPIEFARANFAELAKQERRRRENTTITVTVQDVEVEVDTDAAERAVMVSKLATMADDHTVNWKFTHSWMQLTKQDLQTLVSAVDQHVQSTFDWEKGINDEISAAQNGEQLLNIEIITEDDLDPEFLAMHNIENGALGQ